MSAAILKGAPVAAAINARTREKLALLSQRGITPALAIVRVGARADDAAYERAAMKRCAELGIAVKNILLPETVSQEDVLAAVGELNGDGSVHGVLIFRPLPAHISDEAVRGALEAEKDVDGITDGSLAGVLTGSGRGYPPCTAQAVIEVLDHYGVEISGSRAAVVGRSLVVGRPAALLLMRRNATVTVCHTRTADMPSVTRGADIVVAAAGRAEMLTGEYFRAGQTVVDVGINWDERLGRLCGDVKFDEAERVAGAITPVPGGVGAITTAILAAHVVDAAGRQAHT